MCAGHAVGRALASVKSTPCSGVNLSGRIPQPRMLPAAGNAGCRAQPCPVFTRVVGHFSLSRSASDLFTITVESAYDIRPDSPQIPWEWEALPGPGFSPHLRPRAACTPSCASLPSRHTALTPHVCLSTCLSSPASLRQRESLHRPAPLPQRHPGSVAACSGQGREVPLARDRVSALTTSV